MPFRVKKSESLGKALRRSARECMAGTRGQLRSSRRPSAIHGARKEIKKLRAVFRLVRGELDEAVYHQAMKALRKAANRLAATRDARVTFKAFERLAGRRSKNFPRLLAALKKRMRQAEQRFQKDASLAQARKQLRKAGRCVDALKIRTAGWMALEPGLKEIFAQGRDAYERAGRDPRPENFHAWRKRVKSLWYCLSLLHPAWSPSTHHTADDLKLLGEQLGDEHDLQLLRQLTDAYVRKHEREAVGLLQLLKKRQEKLRKSVLKLGRRLFADDPELFCRRLQSEWIKWRGNPG